MASRMDTSVLLAVTLLLLLASVFQKDVALKGSVAATLVSVLPMWGIVDNNTQQCQIEEGHSSQGDVFLHGSPHHTCGLRVNISLGYHAQITTPVGNASGEPVFIYAERKGDLLNCNNRYVAFYENMRNVDEVCSAVLLHNSVSLYVQGNVSILVSGIPAIDSHPLCPEYNDNLLSPEVNQTARCHGVKGYTNRITCDPDRIDRCKLVFPSSCNATVRYREVSLNCINNGSIETQESLLIYPINTSILDLRYNNIVKFDNNFQDPYGNRPGVFAGLYMLKELFININRLTHVDEDLFKGLTKLTHLYMSDNELSWLPRNLFSGLTNLNVLTLYTNQLVDLNENIYHELSNLTDLWLYSNKLKSLSNSLFNKLINLKLLVFRGNQLIDLNEDIFNDLNSLTDLDLSVNKLTSLPNSLFKGLVNVTHLWLYQNQLHVTGFNVSVFNYMTRLTLLNVADNRLKSLPGSNVFKELHNLNELYLNYNELATLNPHLFDHLNKLTILLLNRNKLMSLPYGIFNNLTNLEFLILEENYLKTLRPNVFYNLFNLKLISLSDNSLTHIDYNIFKGLYAITRFDIYNNYLLELPNIKHLTELRTMNIIGNELTGLTPDTFSALATDSHLIASQHEICECYVPAGVRCSASDERSPYLTCDRLLSDKALLALMCLIGINALFGNMFVLIWRKVNTKIYKVQDLLLSNLAMSDSLMGFYMMIVALADIYYGGFFPMQSETWRTGITCRVAGALSIASTELSVFFLVLISIDRFTCIKYPYSNKKLGKRSTIVLSTIVWLFSLAMGVVPSVLSGRNFKFYDNSQVCIGLPLALTKTYSTVVNVTFSRVDNLDFTIIKYNTKFTGFANGLYFSTVIFLGLNSICYLIILGCYVEIVRAVKKSAKQAGRTPDMNEQIRLTKKVTAIVATDFMCIFPIILIGILVQTRIVELPASVYAWSVTFVLPINSAINPYLYTIAEIVSKFLKEKNKK